MTSRREALMKATAGALHPEGLDLTQFRQRSARDGEAIRIKRVDLVNALGSTGVSWRNEKTGDEGRGDPLISVLFRLKYGQQKTQALYKEATIKLVGRVSGRGPRRPPRALYAVAGAAVFEWTNDACHCRRRGRPGPKGTLKTLVKLEDEARAAVQEGRSPKAIDERRKKVASGIFDNIPGKGMVCRSCGNRGRSYYTPKARWRLVNLRMRGHAIPLEVFEKSWAGAFKQLLSMMRALDKAIGSALDTQNYKMDNPGIFQEFDQIECPVEEFGAGPRNA